MTGVVYFIGDRKNTFYVAIPRQELRATTIETELRSVKLMFRTIHIHDGEILLGELKMPSYARARSDISLTEAEAKAIVALGDVARQMFDDLASTVDTDVTWSVTDGEWSRKETRPA